ncbi:MAG: hypothetical protein HYV20_08140 [Gemmatimonadetes bacterium]|nr:hypothetical protein [Gemmatimonadota bacterium]
MSGKLRVVVLGMVGRMPLAGMAWQALHYLEGLRRLGWDVYYVEDTGDWPYDPERNTITDDCRYAVDYLARVMGWGGLGDRWAYRAPAPDSRTFGLSESRLAAVWASADALINLCGATVLRDEHLRVPVRVYLETDPVLRQIEVAEGCRRTIRQLGAHTHLFTYGANLGAPDCPVPLGPFRYHATRPPVILDWWPAGSSAGGARRRPLRFTTVSTWRQSGKDVTWHGETFLWSKHGEFLKLLELPRRTGQALELALAGNNAEATGLLTAGGWSVVHALRLSKEIVSYRDYIRGSRGEFTVAKDQYVRLKTGWFSDRSVCYLAAGRPVVLQETGFSKFLPTGKGLFAFRTLDEILGAFEAINADYDGNARAARDIAQSYFAAERVVAGLLERAGHRG